MIVGRYYTSAEVAHILGFQESTIRKWTREGRLPAVNFGSDSRPAWRYPIEDFDAWEAAYRQNNRADLSDEDNGKRVLWPATSAR